ncbi:MULTISPECIES: universal stress protein [Amycolatopsis]|uniref:Universal stress protein n=3 Tax=Amycolatopsis TaxID=1813 RepID=M2XCD3_9PSEU|nr:MULTISPECIES: universal stress protein [Amycolatopsis]RSN20177.1 universal stress protein [Streptomyces sp. WAC 05977]EME58766.1 universal stress protein [Amycolatopsis decaplanina DSM 44594]MBE1575621.1 nucleotide-binding universal stress UspA family protein [Amycolatopsis roodepoortensis]OLZ57606.1 universal stress protein [Amycolatopsis keratiniphila subsp. nogabecina]ONF67844.1 universal stress protein [Amycolatopsis keratiniphila subsp. keratiniphila]
MAAYRTVVVGTDGSDSSFAAVDRAAGVAGDSGATLVIVCAYYPANKGDVEKAQDVLGDEAYQVVGSAPAEDTLLSARDRAAKAGAKTIETAAVVGDPVDSLRKVVAERSADLLVVGNRGLNTLAGRILGSVPSEVARKSGVDVLIVHTT